MELIDAMRREGVEVEVSVCSAHRNPDDLKAHVRDYAGDVYIGVAGMAAALPGAIASHQRWSPVIGVPLPSPGFENCMDSILAIFRMPPGVPVLAVDSVHNALLAAWQIVTCHNDVLSDIGPANFITGAIKAKPPKFDIPDDVLVAAYEKANPPPKA
jgi:5-(carboxyamino)imidazole ribonucleotide mutase